MNDVIKKWELILKQDSVENITYGRKVLEEILDDIKIAKEKAAIRASYQKEMCELVLTSLVEDRSLNCQVVTAVLMEFLRSLLEGGFESSAEAEKLLAGHLVAQGDFMLLQDCIQYQILRPNQGLCQLLEGELLYNQLAALEQWTVLSTL